MSRRTVLVVSHDPSICGPLLSCLRRLQSRPVLLSDIHAATSAIEEHDERALFILHGPLSYCQTLLDLFSKERAGCNFPTLVVVAKEGSEAFAIAALRA